jgi:dipeptidase E
MSHPYFAQSVVDLTKRSAKECNLLYIGTASYDIPKYRDIQTEAFIGLGCTVQSLDVANGLPLTFDMEEAVEKAHIILVSGGNTLFAVDTWKLVGLDELLKSAAHRGTVMTGGSAGCICWFDGGHSDSMDPDTYRLPMLKEYQEENPNSGTKVRSVNFEEGTFSSMANGQEGSGKEWNYIRVEGLGIFPGLVCPHYCRTQSNGVPRMVDFDAMMMRHPLELGLGIDHFAALEIDGDNFRVLSIRGETGSIDLSVPDESEDGSVDMSRVPGAWIKYVDASGALQSKPCPTSGKVQDLLQMVVDPSKHILLDERVELCRKQNPSPLLE